MVSSSVFRKGDAPSCLVVDKTWDKIINKPDFFDEVAGRIVAMMQNAEEIGYVLETTTFGDFKRMINAILIKPLQDAEYGSSPTGDDENGKILADAFWDEIKVTDSTWEKFKEALFRANAMKSAIGNHSPLAVRDTLQNVKDNFNATIVAPLRGDAESED